MNTLELDKCLKQNKCTRKIYGGTFAADLIPLQRKIKPIFYVVNTQPSSQSGEHWLGVYITSSVLELFDSGGRSFETYPHIEKFIKFHSNKKFKFNSTQIQAFDSDLCGQFVCLFALSKCKNISTKKFISCFNINYRLNDNNFIVLKLFKKYFNCIKQICVNIKCQKNIM